MVAAYIRWSTDDQSDGTTLDVQKESCMHYVKSQGWAFREDLCFIDDGYSGGTLDRPAMTALRQAVSAGQVRCVVVYKLDRLSRSVLDTVNLALEEWEGKCYIKSTREPIDTTTAAGKMFFYMLVSYAEWERAVIRERTLSGKKKRAEQGKNPGIKFPFGYTRGATPGEWAVVEEQAAIVRRIFGEYVGGKGLLTICNELNEQAVPWKYGTPWNISTIQYILKNEAYKGDLVYGARIDAKSRTTGKRTIIKLDEPRHAKVENAMPVIVERELWEAAQAVNRSREVASKRSLSATYLLSGIAKCTCGGPLVGAFMEGKRRIYSCSIRRNRGAAICNALSMKADDVERDVVEAVRTHYRAAGEEDHVASTLKNLNEQRDMAIHSMANFETRIEELRRRQDRLHADYDKGELTARLYSSRSEDTEMEIEKARAEIAKVKGQVAQLDQQLKSLDAVRTEFRQMAARADEWDALTREEQKQFLRHAIDSLTLRCVGKERSPEDRRISLEVIEIDLVLNQPRLA
ncbi:MAG TPA: recombinase family protein [Symbiobacteriaceae bacterium]|nr:recombinase family protein [Symbiobacteriaceae bacterium]